MTKLRVSGAVFGLLFLTSVLSMTGCDVRTEALNAWATLSGQPIVQTQPSPSPVPSPEVLTEGEFTSVAARNAKANSELFHEMFSVVFMREPKDRSEFGNWVDTLNQGASLEGVHNGLIRADEYRKLEHNGTTASVEALKVFSEELAVLENELPTPTDFDPLSSAPSPAVGVPVPIPSPSRDTIDAPIPVPEVSPEVKIQNLSTKYSKLFVGSSIFVLKRILADEALRVISSKVAFREKEAFWYSKWVVHMAARKVDFGVSLRNNPDDAFHYKWAMASSTDRISWEVLNRLHRVLNEANRQKQ